MNGRRTRVAHYVGEMTYAVHTENCTYTDTYRYIGIDNELPLLWRPLNIKSKAAQKPMKMKKVIAVTSRNSEARMPEHFDGSLIFVS